MNCGCCLREARDMGKLTVAGEAMFACDACKPAGADCSGKGYHFITVSHPAAPALPREVAAVKTKKRRVKR